MNKRTFFLPFCFILFSFSACVSDIKKQHALIPTPELPYKIDRRLLPHDRPARVYGKSYEGPMIDIHVHIKIRGSEDRSLKELNDVIGGIREAGVELGIFMPRPNEGRGDSQEEHSWRRQWLKEHGGKTIKLMCCGNYLGQWINNAYHGTYTKEGLNTLLQWLAQDLDSGIYIGVGEFGLYHFNKSGNQWVIKYPPNFEPFVKAVDLIVKKGYWILLHAETVEPGGASYEDKFFRGIELLYKRNPNLKLIIAHTSTTNPANVRRMLQRYPNLMIDFKIVRRLKPWWHTEPVNNAKQELHEDWAKLFEEMPERFMVGTDDKFFRRGMDAEEYKIRNSRMRKVLGTLNPKAARMIAYENAKRLFGKNTH